MPHHAIQQVKDKEKKEKQKRERGGGVERVNGRFIIKLVGSIVTKALRSP